MIIYTLLQGAIGLAGTEVVSDVSSSNIWVELSKVFANVFIVSFTAYMAYKQAKLLKNKNEEKEEEK